MNAKTVPFTEEQWQALADNWNAWWAHECLRPMLMAVRSAPRTKPAPPWAGSLAQIPFDITPEEVAEDVWNGVERTTHYGDAWPSAWMNFGPGVAAAFMGGGAIPTGHTNWFTPGIWASRPLREILPVYDPDNMWYKRVHGLMEAVAEKFAGRAVAGFTDLGGNLDIAASLRDTQALLTDTLDDPEAVGALVRRITKLWVKYYDEEYEIAKRTGRGFRSWAPLWSPKRTYMLQSDFSYMISPAQFEAWVAPDLEECCAGLDHGFYHLDGKGELPHLDILLSLQDLRGVQWIPGDGAPSAASPEWRGVLKRIRAAGKLCQIFGSFADVLALAKEMPLKGFAIEVFVPHGVDPGAALDEILRANKGIA